jgi:hypothetical protein
MLQPANSFRLRQKLKMRIVTTMRAMLRVKKPWMKRLSLKTPLRRWSTPHFKIRLPQANPLEAPPLVPLKPFRLENC